MPDANFNVTALLNISGSMVERYVFDTYGAGTVLDASWAVQSGGSASAWMDNHQGGLLDATVGLDHFRNRKYELTLGRWVTMDPMGYSTREM